MSFVILQQQLCQQLATALGETVSQQELAGCITEADIVEPAPTKQFWLSTDTRAGIYLIISGKVRLLDSAENLITTVGAGCSFGEATLFAQDFVPYTARASSNVKLCYLKQERLQVLMEKYPSLRAHLLERAQLWDLLLIYRQNSQVECQPSDVPGILKALSLFEPQTLDTNEKISAPPEGTLWLLHKGELRHTDSQCLTPGKIYADLKPGIWLATKPTSAYILRSGHWQTALGHWQQ